MTNNLIIPNSVIDTMINDRKVRTSITRESHFLFFHFYFPHYVTYPTAEFQKEIFALTEDETIKNFFVVAFRGSGKSTIVTTSFPIWAILGRQKIKFVLILCQTRNQSKQHMTNLKRELESNILLKKDLGPFESESDEWGSSSLVFSKYGARITAASTEQSIRGLRHNQYRPSLLILDDCEDLASTKTEESRTKTYQWLTGEVIPAGDRNTRLVVVGNLLHEDSLLMKIRNNIQNEKIEGVFKEYPLLDVNGICSWPGKYPTNKDIENEKRQIGNETSWQREYLLRIIPDDDQVVRPEWIHYYDQLPDFSPQTEHRFAIISADLAISQESSADFTAIIVAEIFGYGKNVKIYILPDPINERLTFPETVEKLKAMAGVFGLMAKIIVEDAGYQKSVIQQLAAYGLNVEGFTPHGQDKRARLSATTQMIKSGHIIFPKHGAEKMIRQIIGFGAEKHDDLVDSFSMIVIKIIESENCYGEISFFSGDNEFDSKKYGLNKGNTQEETKKSNEEERKKLEREADLEILQRDFNQCQSGYFFGQ